MKGFIWIIIISALSLTGCKKSSETKGNYLRIDDDTRQLGFVPSADIFVNNFFPYSQSNEIIVNISNKANDIDGLENNRVIIDIDFWNDLSLNEYPIANTSEQGTVALYIYITGPTYNGGGTAVGGKLYLTKDEDGKVNSIKFENVQITGIHNATVSSEIKFYE
jgi:hypothetical protein